jgi:hypothetical protein
VPTWNGASPVSYARVELLSEEIPSFDTQATTAPDGSYTFDRLPPGQYKLLVRDPDVNYPLAIRDHLKDYADIMESIEVHANDRISRDLRSHVSNR